MYKTRGFLLLLSFFAISAAMPQPITGVWKGNMGKQRVELKLVKSGDSLAGTAYYYASAGNYKRYSIKGYFDPKSNDAIWWDDALIEDKSKSGFLKQAANALLSIADFNCPGEDEMRLDGNSFFRDEKRKVEGTLNLQKKGSPLFPDEWDWVIKNYTVGANDPYIIDSIAALYTAPHDMAEVKRTSPQKTVSAQREQAVTNTIFTPAPTLPAEKKAVAVTALTPEEKFTSRTKKLQQVIPIKGDSIELSFYDNAEIDGDSIALFLNNRLIFKHVMLTDKPYTVKFAVKDLEADNDAVMVAENLGSIPPNTALMVVMVGDKRYEAHLYSDENSSALVRFVK